LEISQKEDRMRIEIIDAGGTMKDNRRNKSTNKELADSSVKKAVDGVYDLLMVNALFMLFNLHILLFLLFLKPANIVLYYLLIALLSLNLLPSYSALIYAVRKKREGSSEIMVEFFNGYKENFKKSLIIGSVGAVLIAFTSYNALFFFITEMNLIYWALQLIIFFMVFAVLATVPAMVFEKGTLREVLSGTRRNFSRLLLGAAAATMIILLSLYLGRIIVVPLIFGFALAAMAQDVMHVRMIGQSKKR